MLIKSMFLAVAYLATSSFAFSASLTPGAIAPRAFFPLSLRGGATACAATHSAVEGWPEKYAGKLAADGSSGPRPLHTEFAVEKVCVCPCVCVRARVCKCLYVCVCVCLMGTGEVCRC